MAGIFLIEMDRTMGLKSSVGGGVKRIGRVAGRGASQVGAALVNTRRRLMRGRIPDYIVITLDRALAERPGQRPWWLAYLPGVEEELTLAGLSQVLQRIAGDPDVRGVLFLLKGTELTLSRAQNMAELFDRFRRRMDEHEGGVKELVVYAESVNGPTAVLLSAADRAVMPPAASWDVIGLQVTSTFLKEPLARVGIELEVARVAPWKTAADSLSRSEMSDAQREQLNWMLESLHGTLIDTISRGRSLARDDVAALIDRGPLTADAALAASLVDHLAYEDELPTLLGRQEAAETEAVAQEAAEAVRELERVPALSNGKPAATASPPQPVAVDAPTAAPIEPAKLATYSKSHRLLKYHVHPPSAGRIGVISLAGAIVPGRSRRFPVPLPLLGGDLIGSSTAQQQIRAARRDASLKAVVVYVDSPGGSALASDLIWRELTLLDDEKPVVIYMGAVAASGGYYIATPGRKIVAQSATLTGSIGVILAKVVNDGLWRKIGATTETIRRGENAGIFQPDAPWSAAQRTILDDQIDYTYRLFKQRVAEGRKLDYDALEPLCGGRVWTGEQALSHGLVDVLGDFQTAVEMAQELAGLAETARVEVVNVGPEKEKVLPLPARESLDEAARAAIFARELADGTLLRLLSRERCWLLAENLYQINA
jgi:protease-4